ncbi:MAG: tRNA1(Val) (adenine(37)-N6)-methyltransferase [Candidatus Cryptobacteroides sp.]
MSVFHFKKFNVENSRSAMKVNTDGVLLGAVATIESADRQVLDIGTGTGVIALMLAQRYDSDGLAPEITGIDIDHDAADEAGMNFRNSPWSGMMASTNMSLEDYSKADGTRMYDLIVSNPPYYDSSLTNPNGRKAAARHTGEGLSYREIMEFAKDRLSETGRLALVLPADQEAALSRYGRMCGFSLSRILRIRTVERKQATRIITVFSRTQALERHVGSESARMFAGSKPVWKDDTTLTLMEKGKYTDQYISLVKDFYLFA